MMLRNMCCLVGDWLDGFLWLEVDTGIPWDSAGYWRGGLVVETIVCAIDPMRKPVTLKEFFSRVRWWIVHSIQQRFTAYDGLDPVWGHPVYHWTNQTAEKISAWLTKL